jgi:phosphate transport system ATP-binding protein
VATKKIAELMQALKEKYTIIIVIHNMQQAGRVSDFTAFMMIGDQDTRTGVLAECGPTRQMFANSTNKQTKDDVTGRYG